MYILCIKDAYYDRIFPEMFYKLAVSLNFLNSCLIWYWCGHCFKACCWYILNLVFSSKLQYTVIEHKYTVMQHKVWVKLFEDYLHYWEEYHTTLSFLYLQKSQRFHLSRDPILLALIVKIEFNFRFKNSPKVKKSKIGHMLIDIIGVDTATK